MKNNLVKIVVIIIVCLTILMFMNIFKSDSKKPDNNKKKSNASSMLLTKAFPQFNITLERIISCNKYEGKCKIAEIKLSDMVEMMSDAKNNDKEAINNKVKEMETRIQEGDKEFYISDIVTFKCDKIEVEKSIGKRKYYEIDYGNHNEIRPGYKKSHSSSEYYARVPQYKASLLLNTEQIDLNKYYDTERECRALGDDVSKRIRELPENGYVQVFGGGINDTPEQKAKKEEELKKLMEKSTPIK